MKYPVFFLISVIAFAGLGNSCALTQLGRHANQAILEESDYQLTADSLPAFLKIAEIAHRTYPDNRSFTLTLASLNMLYANAFLEGEAFYLLDTDYDAARQLQLRARNLYLRTIALLEPLIRNRSKRLFSETIDLSDTGSSHTKLLAGLVKPFRVADIDAMFYFAASTLAAFALDPLDFTTAQNVPIAVLLVRRGMELDADFNNGMLRDLAFTVYGSLPEGLGGNKVEALAIYEHVMIQPDTASASLLVSYATTFCAPDNDYPAFVSHLERAIAMAEAADAKPSLMNSLAARKARYILENSWLYIDTP